MTRVLIQYKDVLSVLKSKFGDDAAVTMGFPILVRWHIDIESAPSTLLFSIIAVEIALYISMFFNIDKGDTYSTSHTHVDEMVCLHIA